MGTDKMIDDLADEAVKELLGDLEVEEIQSRKIANLETRIVGLADQMTKLVDGVATLTNIVSTLADDLEKKSKLTDALLASIKSIANVCTMHDTKIKDLEELVAGFDNRIMCISEDASDAREAHGDDVACLIDRILKLETAAGITHD